MTLREALDMYLVDHRIAERDAWMAVLVPIEIGTDHHRLLHACSTVVVVPREVFVGVSELIWKNGLAPIDASADGAGVGVNQKLRWIEAVALRRIVWAMHAISIQLTGVNARQVAMPDVIRLLAHLDFFFALAVVEQAQLDAFRALGVQSEVDADSIPRRALRKWPARQHSSHHASTCEGQVLTQQRKTSATPQACAT